jgi:hypothetical protein
LFPHSPHVAYSMRLNKKQTITNKPILETKIYTYNNETPNLAAYIIDLGL